MFSIARNLIAGGSKCSRAIFSGSRNYANQVTVSTGPVFLQKEKTSRAMKVYLERAQEHEDFMKQQKHEFEVGKRHLANMMGEDPETFTQDDIDKAIEYLFPSGIFDPKARPLMKSPEEIFPKRKAAEFDEYGRPHHSMFFTGRPNFFKLLFDIAEHIEQLNSYEDRMIRRQTRPDETQLFEMSGSQWLPKAELETSLVEMIEDIEYDNFVNAMTRLSSLPYAYRVKDFIFSYRKPLISNSHGNEIPTATYDEKGRQVVTTYECLRKRARADVTLICPGTGQVTINGQDINYFPSTQCREQVLFPLVFANMAEKVDIIANVAGGGSSGQAGAIRWGVAMSLRSFVDQETLDRMRLAGLLQRDYRRRERKKPGQEGARRKFTWKKR